MLIGSFRITIFRLRIEEEHLPVLHPYYKIHIEQSPFALRVGVRYGIMLLALIAILIPPVYVFFVLFQEIPESLLWC